MKHYKTLFTTFALLFFLIFASKAYCAESHYYYGDANGNGTVTSEDALLILKDAAKLEQIEGELYRTLADIDKSGELTANDALETLRVAAKLNPSTEYVPQPTPETERFLTVHLSNGYQSVYTDKYGNITNGLCQTKVIGAYLNNIIDVSSAYVFPPVTYSATPSDGVSGYWNESEKTYTVTSLTAIDAYVDISVYYQDVVGTARFTLKNMNPVETGTEEPEVTESPTEEPEFPPLPTQKPDSAFTASLDNDYQEVYVDDNDVIVSDCKTKVIPLYMGLDVSSLFSLNTTAGPKVEVAEGEGISGYWNYNTLSYYVDKIWVEKSYVDIKLIYSKSESCTLRFIVKRAGVYEPEQPEYDEEEAINALSYTVFEDKEDNGLYFLISSEYKYDLELAPTCTFFDYYGNVISTETEEKDTIRSNGKCVFKFPVPMSDDGYPSYYKYSMEYNIENCKIEVITPWISCGYTKLWKETIFIFKNYKSIPQNISSVTIVYYEENEGEKTVFACRKVKIGQIPPNQSISQTIENPDGRYTASNFEFYIN